MIKTLAMFLTLMSLSTFAGTMDVGEGDDLIKIGRNVLTLTTLEDINFDANTSVKKITNECEIQLNGALQNEGRISADRDLWIREVRKVKALQKTYYRLTVGNLNSVEIIECSTERDSITISELRDILSSSFRLFILNKKVVELN